MHTLHMSQSAMFAMHTLLCPHLQCNVCYGMPFQSATTTRKGQFRFVKSNKNTIIGQNNEHTYLLRNKYCDAYFTHAQTSDVKYSKCYGMYAVVHTLHTSKPVKYNSCSKCSEWTCFDTYFPHVLTCNVTHVQSAAEWTASVHALHSDCVQSYE